jgi:hypothetical protein
MLSQNDLSQVSGLIESFKPKVTYYEKEILVPNMIGRLNYIVEVFEEFKVICERVDVAREIDGPLRVIVDPRAIELGARPPVVGQRYLAEISRQCDEQFIAPIRELLASHPKEQINSSIENTTNFLNEAATFFRSIVGCKDTLMLLNMQTFPVVENLRTREIVLGAPQEHSLTIMPFKTRLAEVQNVADSSVKSIELWGNQIGKQKTEHVTLISNLATLKSTKLNFYTQVAVVLVALALFWLSYRANLFLEKKDLEDSIAKLKTELISVQENEASLVEKVRKMEAEIQRKSQPAN